MHFEINDQVYVVNFVPEEGRCYVLAPTEHGVIRLPVAMDGPLYDTFGFPSADHKREVVH